MGEIIFNEKPAPGEYLEHHKYIRREGTPGHYRYYYDTKDLHTQAQGSKTQPVHASRGDSKFDYDGRSGFVDKNGRIAINSAGYVSGERGAGKNSYFRQAGRSERKAIKKFGYNGLNRLTSTRSKRTTGNAALDNIINTVRNMRASEFIRRYSK